MGGADGGGALSPLAADFVDAVVVGSGFGGSVAAHRLSEQGRHVVVMERGRAYPPGSFARTPSEFGQALWDPSAGLHGLFNAWTMRGLESLVSSGLGGGSLIYANVLLRKDEHWFVNESPLPGGGYESWPLTRDDLEPHYQRVEDMIGTATYPYSDTPKTEAVEGAARALGLSVSRPPLAVTFAPRPGAEAAPGRGIPAPGYGNYHGRPRRTCTLCGECDIGCNEGAKNTLDHTYLSAAQASGHCDIRPLHEVRTFSREPDGTWLVRYVVHTPDDPAATRDLPERVIRCSRLILAAGTFGTTFLLLRNRVTLPGLSNALGTRFSGNGDLLGFLMNATQLAADLPGPRRMLGSTGPVITTAIRVGDAADGEGGSGRGYYIEDAGYPGFVNWLMEASQIRSAVPRLAQFATRIVANRLFGGHRSNISADLAALLGPGSFSESSLPLLGMGRDIPDGRMFLRDGRLAVDWTLSTSRDYFDRVQSTMRDIAGQLGADFRDNPLWMAQRVITVHPLGGAPMGAHPGVGVCDPYSAVYGQPGLHVVDGSAMPGPVGANPALTIAACADRASERMLEEPWAQPVVRAASRPAAVRRHPGEGHDGGAGAGVVPSGGVPTRVSFTERMKGNFALGLGDPQQANAQARLRDQRMMFELTITTEDVDRFVADPAHPGVATGYLTADLLGGRCEVGRGWFNLFVRQDEAGKLMLYRLFLTSPGGVALTFVGYKDVHDGPGLDVWQDTTTLYVQVLQGHVPPPEPLLPVQTPLLEATDPRVAGAGILYIQPLDFARQLTTFTTSGPDGWAGLARFGRLFLGSLWESYRGPAQTVGAP
ncbi:GMC family oxidoreductase [Citricoccus sp. NPDC055426]|uniref:GMC family oxidoreductase n=1 Tax=Citricoccus sp. NPDC055426 TaxID=3155536 RepID=UPI003434AABA